MQYTVNVNRNNSVEPWNIFINLLHRNYGDNLCKVGFYAI